MPTRNELSDEQSKYLTRAANKYREMVNSRFAYDSQRQIWLDTVQKAIEMGVQQVHIAEKIGISKQALSDALAKNESKK